MQGNVFDVESELPHLNHAATSLLFAIYITKRDNPEWYGEDDGNM